VVLAQIAEYGLAGAVFCSVYVVQYLDDPGDVWARVAVRPRGNGPAKCLNQQSDAVRQLCLLPQVLPGDSMPRRVIRTAPKPYCGWIETPVPAEFAVGVPPFMAVRSAGTLERPSKGE
jgi:hypothetical protein